MRLPFTIHKQYMTHLTEPQIGQFLEYLRTKKRGMLFFKVASYGISTEADGFVIKKRSLSRSEPAYPEIKGRICRQRPTVLELSITPQYAGIVFHAFIPAFAVGVIAIQQHLSITAVFTSPGLFERMFWVCLASLVALALCYFSVLMPVADAELWLIKKLCLKELPASSSHLQE